MPRLIIGILFVSTVPALAQSNSAPNTPVIQFTFSDASTAPLPSKQVSHWQPISQQPTLQLEPPATQVDLEPDDDSPLPKVASVNDPITAAPLSQLVQQDPLSLLSNLPAETAYLIADTTTYSELSETPSIPSMAHWQPPNFTHRPLLFDQPDLERYGNRTRAQSVASGLHFFGTIPVLPYKLGKDGRRLQSTYGYRRPGDCVPSRVERFQPSVKGGILQAIVTTAIILP